MPKNRGGGAAEEIKSEQEQRNASIYSFLIVFRDGDAGWCTKTNKKSFYVIEMEKNKSNIAQNLWL